MLLVNYLWWFFFTFMKNVCCISYMQKGTAVLMCVHLLGDRAGHFIHEFVYLWLHKHVISNCLFVNNYFFDGIWILIYCAVTLNGLIRTKPTNHRLSTNNKMKNNWLIQSLFGARIRNVTKMIGSSLLVVKHFLSNFFFAVW